MSSACTSPDPSLTPEGDCMIDAIHAHYLAAEILAGITGGSTKAMACEERIVRVLQTLEYPGLLEATHGSGSATSSLGLAERPQDLAKIVSWIEDRKVRGLAISDRAPLRDPGPNWRQAFFSYLKLMGCPYNVHETAGGAGAGAAGGEESSSSCLLRGLSWLVSEAVACDFEDNGKAYMASVRQLLSKNPVSHSTGGEGMPKSVRLPVGSTDGVVAMDDSSAGARSFSPELEGFEAGVDTGDDACDGVATVLRMLHISDLRILQDEVNGIIALAQSSRT